MVSHSRPIATTGLDELVTAARAVVCRHADSRQTARRVAGELVRRLPSPDVVTAEQRVGDPAGYRSFPLHTEPDGTFSIHIYGTEVSRIGSSVRRYYDEEVVPR
jgi:hypothetical protein